MNFSTKVLFKDVVVQWFSPLTLQPEQAGGVSSIPGPHHFCIMARGHRLNQVCSISAIPVLGAENTNFNFTFTKTFLI